MSDAFRIHNDMMGLAPLAVIDDIIDDSLLIVVILLRQQQIIRSGCNAAPECNIAGMSSHHLDHRASLMRTGGVSYFINGFHGGIDGGVETDRIIRTGNVQIDRSRQTHRIDAQPGKCLRTAVRTVASNHHQAVNAVLLTDFHAALLTLERFKFQATRCTQNGSAVSDDIGDTAFIHINDLFVQ